MSRSHPLARVAPFGAALLIAGALSLPAPLGGLERGADEPPAPAVPAPPPSERVSAPPERALSAFAEDPARRFDFWIGDWDVNLRMRQDDLTFADSVAARARIYGILDRELALTRTR